MVDFLQVIEYHPRDSFRLLGEQSVGSVRDERGRHAVRAELLDIGVA
jgi:hypothetical protein